MTMMFSNRLLATTAAFAVVMAFGNAAIAQDGNPNNPTPPPRIDGDNLGDNVVGSIGIGTTLGIFEGSTTPEVTVNIVEEIRLIREFCSWFPQEVRIPCLADRLRVLANELPNDATFRPMKRALLDASADLKTVAEKYAAPTPPRRFRAPSPATRASVRTEPLRAVRKDRLDAANAEAARVIDELQTVLLRSAENSRRRMLAYQEVSAALSSTKVLLRSA